MKAGTCDPAEIGARMKAARDALRISRPAFTTECGGITVRTLENNEGGVNEARACLIAAFVRRGVNANWLLTGEGPMLLADLAPKPTPINEGALAMILAGILMGMGERPDPERAATKAVQYYQDALAEGLITPTGIGTGGRSAA